jgi:hypothetical protein
MPKLPLEVYRTNQNNILYARFTEDIQDIRNNKSSTSFSQHKLNNGHSSGNIEEVMTILNQQKKKGII